MVPTAAGLQLLRNNSQISQRNLALIGSAAAEPTGTTTINGLDIPVGLVDAGSLGNRKTIAGSAGLNFVATPGDRVAARYVQNEIESSFSGVPIVGANTPLDRQSILASIAYTHSGTAWWSNAFRLGYTRLDDGYNPDAFNFTDGTPAPQIAIQEIDLNLGSRYPCRNARFNTYQLHYNLSLMFGRHDVQVGADARRIISANPAFRSSPGVISTPRWSDSYSIGARTWPRSALLAIRRSTRISGSFRAGYKIASTLTVEAGLRYQWAEVPEFARRQGLNSALNVDDLVSFRESREDHDAFGRSPCRHWTRTRSAPSAQRFQKMRRDDGGTFRSFGILERRDESGRAAWRDVRPSPRSPDSR